MKQKFGLIRLNNIPEDIKIELIHIRDATKKFTEKHLVEQYQDNFNMIFDLVLKIPDSTKKKVVEPQPIITKKQKYD